MESASANFSIFDLTRPGFEPPTFLTQKSVKNVAMQCTSQIKQPWLYYIRLSKA